MGAFKPNYSKLCQVIGDNSLKWAAAEQNLDLCVTIIFRLAGGSKLRKDLELPRSLTQKTKFVRDALRRLPSLKPFADAGKLAMDEMDDLALRRNIVTHGAVLEFHRQSGTWDFLKFEYGKDIHTARPVSVSLDALEADGIAMMDLSAKVGSLSKSLLRRFAPPHAQ